MDTTIRSELDSQITQSRYKGKLTGAKPPLRPKHVWAVRTRLQLANRLMDLALFDLAIDSNLRGCDVVALKVVDVAHHGYAVDRASVRQCKTGRPVRFEITEQTRQAIGLPSPTGRGVQSIPVSRMRPGRSSEHAAIRKTVAEWLAMIGLDLLVRHAFTSQDQGNPHLQKNGESSRSPTPPRSQRSRVQSVI